MKFIRKNPVDFSEFSRIPDWEIMEYAKRATFHFYNLAKSGLILQLKKYNNDCIFLKRTKCEIYEVRPYICRLFPFWFLRRKGRFEIINCIGYKNVCIIPESVLSSYRKEKETELLEIAREYSKEMNNYRIKIRNFVKEYLTQNVPAI